MHWRPNPDSLSHTAKTVWEAILGDDREGYGGKAKVIAGLADCCSVDAQVIIMGPFRALLGATDRPDPMRNHRGT